jgi:putative flippase GtrA
MNVYDSTSQLQVWRSGVGQVIRFALVGVMNSAVDLLVYYLLTRWIWGTSASDTLA